MNRSTKVTQANVVDFTRELIERGEELLEALEDGDIATAKSIAIEDLAYLRRVRNTLLGVPGEPGHGDPPK